MNNIIDYKEIISYKGKVGKIIIDNDNNYRFYPAGYGTYFYTDLEIIKNINKDVCEINSQQGKEYAIKEFNLYRKLKKYMYINDKYQIIIGSDELYYPLINYKGISRSFNSLQSALIGMVVYDILGSEDFHLLKYLFKLLDLKW